MMQWQWLYIYMNQGPITRGTNIGRNIVGSDPENEITRRTRNVCLSIERLADSRRIVSGLVRLHAIRGSKRSEAKRRKGQSRTTFTRITA